MSLFIFQMIDNQLVKILPPKETTLPPAVKSPFITNRRKDLIEYISRKMDTTWQFSATCEAIAKNIRYGRKLTDKSRRLRKCSTADTTRCSKTAGSADKAAVRAAEAAVKRFLATGKISRRYLVQLKKVLYITGCDIRAYHKQQCALRFNSKKQVRDLAYFCRHIRFFIKNTDRIAADKDFYNVKPDMFGCSFAYTGRSAPVTLGELLLHYKTGAMMQPCPKCGSPSYVFYACGSPLSGANSYSAVCPKCRSSFKSNSSTVWDFFKPLMHFTPRYRYEPSPYTLRRLAERLKSGK